MGPHVVAFFGTLRVAMDCNGARVKHVDDIGQLQFDGGVDARIASDRTKNKCEHVVRVRSRFDQNRSILSNTDRAILSGIELGKLAGSGQVERVLLTREIVAEAAVAHIFRVSVGTEI